MNAHTEISARSTTSAQANLSPDLTGLARGTASIIEMIAGQAIEAIDRKIDERRSALAKAKPGSTYHRDLKGELDMWIQHQAEARRFQSAAKRIRMSRLTPAEQDRIAKLRDRNPGVRGSVIDLMVMEVPVEPLDLAGLRLDAANAEMNRLCDARNPLPEEDEFGHAEDAQEKARTEYSRLLTERTGHEAEAILRRLG